ncbi:Rhomboid-related protein 4 [Mactra antiquata]
MFRGRRQRGQNFGVMLLALQIFQYGFDRIPPVTLVTIISQVAIFLGIGDLNQWFGSWQDVCISTHYVVRQKQWNRILLGTLVHSDDMHLYYNMVSMLWKGSSLERRFKSHLAGILVGLMYIKGPLKTIMDSFMSPEPSYRYTSSNTGYRSTNTRGFTLGGQRPEADRGYNQNNDTNYHRYTGGLSEEEQIRQATEESRRHQSGYDNPDIEDLRRRRAERYT